MCLHATLVSRVNHLHICDLRKAPLAPLPIVEPFGRVHIDHIGPLPKTTEGYRHVLVVVDSTTLWCEAFPTRSTTAEETASILYREIICR